MKNKFTAALLALLFGSFGTHRFYLGQQGLGITYFSVFGALVIAALITNLGPIFLPMVLLAFLDAVILLAQPKADFDAKYNPALKEPFEFMDKNLVYDEMERNQPKMLNSGMPEEDVLDLKRLDQIEHYGKLLDQGYITQKEFEQIKERILGR